MFYRYIFLKQDTAKIDFESAFCNSDDVLRNVYVYPLRESAYRNRFLKLKLSASSGLDNATQRWTPYYGTVFEELKQSGIFIYDWSGKQYELQYVFY